MSVPPYALEELGWLQFQDLCDLALELEGGAECGRRRQDGLAEAHDVHRRGVL